MRVLLTGATGFIGSAVLARLAAEGHDVRAVARRPGAGLTPAEWCNLDLARTTDAAAWRPLLEDMDAVVHCAGVLQDGPGDSSRGVHVEGTAALYRACEDAGVRRVVHVSAIGVDREPLSTFSASKKLGEEALMARALDWVILRPSVVTGRAAYGGSALIRGLAALPVLFRLPGTGPMQVVQLDDLVETILFFLRPDAPARFACDVAGPERLSLEEVILTYRRWLRLGEPRRVAAPRWFAALLYRLGDLAGLLGWRPPVRSNARREFVRGAVGDPRSWTEVTGIRPRSLAQALAAEPASVQERWFARLYILKPVVLAGLSLFWIATAVVSLTAGWNTGLGYMREAGLGAAGAPGIVAGAAADCLVGLGIVLRKTAKPALYAALGLSVFYLMAGSFLLPRLWADPLGPMMKILPVIALNLAAIAIVDDR